MARLPPEAVDLIRAADRVHGATALLASASSREFTSRARHALRRAGRRFAADDRRLDDALDVWLGSVSAGPEPVVGALVTLRRDITTVRKTLAHMRVRGSMRRTRTTVRKALAATEVALRELAGALTTAATETASRRLASAEAAFARADQWGQRANRALGCEGSCSWVLPR